MQIVGVKVEILEEGKGLPLPKYSTPGAAAMDLYAAITQPFIILEPGQRMLISTGIAIALPEGYEAQIRPRSGLALNFGVFIVNRPGTIDSDYRGPVGVILINHSRERPVKIERGMRIAQMVIAPVVHANWIEGVIEDDTERGASGFGSTGK